MYAVVVGYDVCMILKGSCMYMILRGRQTAAADDDWCKLLAAAVRAWRQGEQNGDVT